MSEDTVNIQPDSVELPDSELEEAAGGKVVVRRRFREVARFVTCDKCGHLMKVAVEDLEKPVYCTGCGAQVPVE